MWNPLTNVWQGKRPPVPVCKQRQEGEIHCRRRASNPNRAVGVTSHHADLLRPWCSELLDKLTVAQLFDKSLVLIEFEGSLPCCLYHQNNLWLMEPVNASETSKKFYQTKSRNTHMTVVFIRRKKNRRCTAHFCTDGGRRFYHTNPVTLLVSPIEARNWITNVLLREISFCQQKYRTIN